jgi:choline dehydrogenase-like flavoprotein
LAAAAGARELVSTGAANPNPGWHLLGTCRMGDDPATSVVDPFGRVHGHDRLWVMDGSVHVTNGSANPVLTIMATARRAAMALASGRLSG